MFGSMGNIMSGGVGAALDEVGGDGGGAGNPGWRRRGGDPDHERFGD